MNVYWLEQTEADLPLENDCPSNNWLSTTESLCLDALRFPKRRADWRLGRWTAKCALSAYLGAPATAKRFREMEICPAPDGAPEAFVSGLSAGVTISLSHRSGIAICAVAPSHVRIGCDLELVESRSRAFVADYFTAKEQEQANLARASANDNGNARNRIVTIIWSAKESALKALRTGLRLDTRSVVVGPLQTFPDLNGWSPLSVRYAGRHLPETPLPASDAAHGLYLGGDIFHGWWRITHDVTHDRPHDIVRTLIAAPAADSPLPLQLPEHGISKPLKFESTFS